MIDPAGSARLAAERANAAGDDVAAAFRAVRPLLHDPAWLVATAEQALAAMTCDPLHLPPGTASRHGFISNLALVRADRVTIGVTLIAGAAARGDRGEPERAPVVTFSGHATMTRLLSADPLPARLATLADDGLVTRSRPMQLQSGALLELDERRQALWVRPPDRAACLLRVRIQPRVASPVPTFDLETGRRVTTVHADEAAARAAMLMSVLRALGDTRAVPLFAQIVEDQAGALRWSAMREWLALDTASAWPRLAEMAGDDPDPALRAAATATLARLARSQAQAA